jgi:hypothetical protein
VLALRARFGTNRIPVGGEDVVVTDQVSYRLDPREVQNALSETQWKLVSEERTVRILDVEALLQHARAGTVGRDTVAQLIHVDCSLNVECEPTMVNPKPSAKGKRPAPSEILHPRQP